MDRFSSMDGRSKPMVQMVRFDCCISEHDRRIFSRNVIGLTENKCSSSSFTHGPGPEGMPEGYVLLLM